MDYNRLIYLLLQVLSLYNVFAKTIIGRDLILTPKQDLQRNGKSLYYVEDVRLKSTSIPWERTLKHVVFVTLFTRIATEALAGDISQLREYKNFMQSPYTRHNVTAIARFGDIITLATGRLETNDDTDGVVGHRGYRFIEGPCDDRCKKDNILALWQIQKIRHRDAHRRYRYEIKYSVSPLRQPVSDLGSFRSNVNDNFDFQSTRNSQQNYIQKDDDYPQHFKYLSYNDESHNFAERRYDNKGERSFRQAAVYFDGKINDNGNTNGKGNDLPRNHPIPQSSVLRNHFSLLPPTLSVPSSTYDHNALIGPGRLNIGEYIKKELLPNPNNPIVNYPAPTTFHPVSNFKNLKPEIHHYHHQTMNDIKSNDNNQQTYSSVFSPPVVTHHFHHHFYLPPNEDDSDINQKIPIIEQQKQQQQQQQQQHHRYHQQQFYNSINTHIKPFMKNQTPPTNMFENLSSSSSPLKIFINPTQQEAQEEQPILLKQNLVRVTGLPILQKPYFYEIIPTSPTPFLIYPAPVVEEESNEGNEDKPFIQSEMLENDKKNYSEPDPLYNQPPEINASQLEMPFTQYQKQTTGIDATKHIGIFTKSDLLKTKIQLTTPPIKESNLKVMLETYLRSNNSGTSLLGISFNDQIRKEEIDQEQDSSIKNIKISTEKTSDSTIRTEATFVEPTLETKTNSAILNKFNTTAKTTIITTPTTTISNTTSLLKLNNNSLTFLTEDYLGESSTLSSNDLRKKQTSKALMDTNGQTLKTTSSTMPSNHLTSNKTNYNALKQLDNKFLSTSTAETPFVRTLARSRLSQTRTTTEQPVLKWMPRRQENKDISIRSKKQFVEIENSLNGYNSLNKSSPLNKLIPLNESIPLNKSNLLNETNTSTNSKESKIMDIQNDGIYSKTYEVLTQKSVSKSISIKTGKNGEEIPIIEDETKNVVYEKTK